MKGDYVEVTMAHSDGIVSHRIVASKAGRKVVWAVKTKAATRWVTVYEMTRTGKTAGDVLQARIESVLSIREHHVDAAEQTAIRRTRKKAAEDMPLWQPPDPVVAIGGTSK